MTKPALSERLGAGFMPPSPMLADYLSLNARWRARHPALVTSEGALDWAELDLASNRVANALRARGLGPGDMVGVVMSNGRAMVETLFGIMKAGGCSVPLNLAVADKALAGMLADCGAKALIVTADQAARMESLADGLPRELLAEAVCAGAPRAGWIAFDAWKAAQSADRPEVNIPPEAPCNVIYSSGTTGLPKGILHTHKGRLDWAYDIALAYRYGLGARTLCTIGLYSNIMWVSMLGTLIAGGTLFVHEGFDADRTLETIARKRITHIAMVPTQWQRLADSGADERTLASIRSAITVGSPISLPLKRRLLEAMPEAFYELYGLTEGILTVLTPEEMAARPESVGKPTPGCDIRILDEADRDCAVGEAGEIVSRARYVMPGYLNRPEATAEIRWIDETGRDWMRTGDIGRLDEEGYLFIVDRKKDMILSGGQNIYPADIEAELNRHPAVEDCAVIGVSDPDWGETPLAVTVLRAGSDVDEETLRGWLNDRLGKRQRVRAVVVVESLPRNPNGKVLKRELRRMHDREAS